MPNRTKPTSSQKLTVLNQLFPGQVTFGGSANIFCSAGTRSSRQATNASYAASRPRWCSQTRPTMSGLTPRVCNGVRRDEPARVHQFFEAPRRALSNLADFSVDGSIHFICMDWRHLRELAEAADEVYDEFKNLCVWSKNNAGMGSLYRSAHELIFVYKHGWAKHVNNVFAFLFRLFPTFGSVRDTSEPALSLLNRSKLNSESKCVAVSPCSSPNRWMTTSA